MRISRQAFIYPRRLVLYAVYDILDYAQANYERCHDTGQIEARIRVFGNESGFVFRFTESPEETIMEVSITEPAVGLSENGQQRALRFLCDGIAQRLENELRDVRPDVLEYLRRAMTGEAI